MKAEFTIDTCAINDFLQSNRNYDREVFKSHWSYIEQMCEEGGIISHTEVFDEIKNGGISVVQGWAKNNRKIFKDYSLPEESDLVTEIGNKFPEFLFQKKDTVAHADPWLIAQAKMNNLTIITSEKANNNTRLPYVAAQFGVECMDIVSFFKSRGFKA